MITPFIEGLVLWLGLIVAIGLQNLYILRQGLSGNYVLTAAVTATIADWVLIAIGVLGLGSFVADITWLQHTMMGVGVAILLYLAFRSNVGAIKGSSHLTQGKVFTNRRLVIGAAVAFAFVNPQAYVDTLLLSGLAGQYDDIASRLAMLVGAGLGALVWYASISLGAKWLRPLFFKPATGRILDLTVAVILLCVAYKLVDTTFHTAPPPIAFQETVAK